jgi:hypothetical protein
VDVAPTVLYLMGEAVPDDMDGKVLEGLFPEGALTSRPPRMRKGTGVAEPEKSKKLTPEEEEKLKAIPYIK